MRYINLKSIISIYIPMIPILLLYKSPVHQIDLSTFIAIILLIICLITNLSRKKATVDPIMIPFLLYSIGITIFTLLISSSVGNINVFLKLIKLIIILTFIIFISYKDFINKKIFINTFLIISLISSTYLLIQYISNLVFNIKIPNLVFYSLIQREEMYNIESLLLSAIYRPSACFLEPGNCAEYILLTTFIYLHTNDNKLKLPIFFSLCSLATISSQGIVYLTFIWSSWLVIKKPLKFLTYKKLILAMSAVIILVVSISKFITSEMFKVVMNRIIDGSEFGGNAIIARSSGYIEYNQLSIVEKIFGTGIGNIPEVFFSSISYFLYVTGIVGILILFFSFVKLIKRREQFVFLLYIIGTSIFSTTLSGMNLLVIIYCFFYMSNNFEGG